jgi:hypothetical protein
VLLAPDQRSPQLVLRRNYGDPDHAGATVAGEPARQPPRQPLVPLDRQHPRAGHREGQGYGAAVNAKVEHQVRRVDAGVADQLSRDPPVGEEVRSGGSWCSRGSWRSRGSRTVVPGHGTP